MGGQIVEVPGHGQVEFPDGMSEDAIVAAIKKNMLAPKTANPATVARNASVIGGTLEAVSNMLSGAVAKPVSDIAGLAAIPLHAAGVIQTSPSDVKSTVQSGMTFEPRSDTGKAIAEYNPIALAAKGVAYVGGKLGGAIQGDNPANSLRGAFGNAVEESVNQAPQFLGVRAANNAAARNAQTRAAGVQEQSRNVVRDQVMDASRDLGMVMPPSQAGPVGMITRGLENIGGKAALKQEATLRNQQAGTRGAIADLPGMPPNTALTVETLDHYRNQVSQPYRDVAALPALPPVSQPGMRGSFSTAHPTLVPQPLPATVVTELSQVRFDANAAWREFRRTGERATRTEAEALSRRADGMETYLENAATAAGRPELIDQMRQARTMIAKSYDVQNALNLGDAGVSAKHLGRALDRGAPLTGNLRTIGQFAEGPGRQFTAEGASVGTPGTSAVTPYAMTAAAAAGHAVAGPVGYIAGGLPLLRGPARSLLLSDILQNRAMRPEYGNVGAFRGAAEGAGLAGILASQRDRQ